MNTKLDTIFFLFLLLRFGTGLERSGPVLRWAGLFCGMFKALNKADKHLKIKKKKKQED